MNQFGQRRHRTYVVPMEVSGEQNIDLLQAGLPRRGQDSFGIAIVRRPVSCVYEQRLPARGHDERGRTSLRVNPVDLEVLGREK